MQLVIKVDLDKTQLSLPEIFKLIGDCAAREEVREEPQFGGEGLIRDSRSHAIGEWAIEDEETERPNPLESPYRAAAIARYVRPGQIEVDRFASVSTADNGAFVQGWLFVPQSEIGSSGADALPPRKPPQSINSTPTAGRRAV
ncbi:hypothetical protein [Occallatibacter riparius]|uniref:Uncharacterized protein n=1 Tax=Occallatibacter riparius TaxID=1002689 RepID=A0A9J7BJT4_9BACT|nr:hypothetical protein [Occallatibacter riparius]UWZ83088.1 hypothetical protein MOP44_21265 [Occallatibacter riparius]